MFNYGEVYLARKHSPFSLDTLKDVPRLVTKDMFMTSIDDKSGYDHVRLSKDSRPYFGIKFAGWYLVYTVLPFGWKSSAFVYQTIGLAATSYCRELGVPVLQYIDDRMLGELARKESMGVGDASGFDLAVRALYVTLEVLSRLGYTVGLGKCSLVPSQILVFLGMLVNSKTLSFYLPDVKKEKFARLRDQILSSKFVNGFIFGIR